MRSSAGIVAGLFLVALAANCGGDNSSTNNTPANAAGQGGEGNTGATSSAGTLNTAGTVASGGEAGTPAVATGCTKDADCDTNAKCVDSVCKKNDGEACTATSECQNNCVDKVCTPGKDDGADCTTDAECAHTCIDGACAPASTLGGDCDADLGAGGAGGAGAGGNSSSAGGAAGAGGAADVPQNPDCEAPLQCVAGKCLTPNGQACKDNPDCIDTCVNSVCKPKGTLNGACDDSADCLEFAGGALVCDPTKKVCKLDLKSPCEANAQCQSNRCICSDASCSVQTCKTPDSVCQCKWSPKDSDSCDNSSANLDSQKQDPNGCTGANFCNGGQCVANDGGACTTQCVYHAAAGNNAAYCSSNGPTACKGGYHGVPSADCGLDKFTPTCSAGCLCTLN